MKSITVNESPNISHSIRYINLGYNIYFMFCYYQCFYNQGKIKQNNQTLTIENSKANLIGFPKFIKLNHVTLANYIEHQGKIASFVNNCKIIIEMTQ